MRRDQYSTQQRAEAPRRWKVSDLVPQARPAEAGMPGASRPTLHHVIRLIFAGVGIACGALVLYPLLRERVLTPCAALESLATRRGMPFIRAPILGGAVTLVVPKAGEAGAIDWLRCTVTYWRRM
ncbi:hypothetical protein GXW74_17285 [Roseomonas eburnea]|uniref:Uncharacterized protein n=1 Tax=Neoroseomonas eburnea TaxID=1346889 RepID=A0A9X9XEW2_9PROT|nr:hypothetical protein [Neoroseomonas eburnea]MBR0682248.1 hypothetical protein [Neoroseomonas eburnea]